MRNLKHLKAGVMALLLVGISFTSHSQSNTNPDSRVSSYEAKKDVDKPGDGPGDPPPANPVGLEENNIGSFQYYPNPCRNYLQIDNESTNSSADFVIYNLTGKEVARKHISQSAQIDVSDLPSGFYLLHHNDKSFKIQKL